MYPRGLVLAAGDEVGAVGGELEVGDDVHLRALIGEDLFARVGVEERDLARLVSCEDHAGHVGEGADGRLAADGVEHGYRFQTLCYFIFCQDQLRKVGGLVGTHVVCRRCRG